MTYCALVAAESGPPDWWQEFKLVQDKIDRIADFRFRVRGWAITVLSALLVAHLSGKVPIVAVYLGALVVAAFALLEKAETIWRRPFLGRAQELESKMRKGMGDDAPRIVRELGRRRREVRSWGLFGWVLLNGDRVFWVLMIGMMAATLFLSHHLDIG